MHDKHRRHGHRHKLAEIRRKQYNRQQRKRFFIVFIITAAIAGIMVGVRQCAPGGGSATPGAESPGSLKDLNKLKKKMDKMGGQDQVKEMLKRFQNR